MSRTPDVGAYSTQAPSQSRRRATWDKPEPCYSKINSTTGLIALSLTSFTTLIEKLPLKEQVIKLHRLHLQLDAVVLRHKAEKFSGSCESYLVAKSCENPNEAVVAIKNIAKDLMEVNKDVKCIVSFGEVGFAVLGSTAWNYQFYGELVTELKTKAEELRPGEMKLMPNLMELLQSITNDEEIGAPSLLMELHKSKQQTQTSQSTIQQEDDVEFQTWWATRVQYTDIWVLVLTFILAAQSIKNQLAHIDDTSEMSYLSLFLQVQCCIVNVFAALGWTINRDWFVQRHSTIMSVVWCTQFFSRAVQTWTHIPRASACQSMPIACQLFAMNGPEKLLLVTAPVNLWISGCLHWCGFVGSLGIVYRTCLGGNGIFDPSQLPSNITTTVLVSFLLLFVLPMAYSIRVEKDARTGFAQHHSTKGKEN